MGRRRKRKKKTRKKMDALYRVPFRRRREHKTDYYARRRMLVSRRLRAVIRKTNRYIIVQIVKATPYGDLTLVSATSRELGKYGYNGSPSNTTAAYLTGLLVAAKAHGQVKDAIADLGLYRVTLGSRLFAAIKGLRDGGIPIPVDEKMFPSEARIRGEHIAEYAKHAGNNMFTKSNPNISEIFDSVVEAIKKKAPRVKIKETASRFKEVARTIAEEKIEETKKSIEAVKETVEKKSETKKTKTKKRSTRKKSETKKSETKKSKKSRETKKSTKEKSKRTKSKGSKSKKGGESA